MTSSPDIEAVVVSALESLGIQYEMIEIDPDFADTADFCQQYGFSLANCGNTIVVASKRGAKNYCACIVSGSDRLDVNHTVRRLMGVSRASFASPDETSEVTGMEIGGVTPFALPESIPIYADPGLLAMDYIILGSGGRSSKVRLAPGDLERLPNIEFVAGLSVPATR